MLKCKYKLFSFNHKDTNRGYTIDKESFLKVLNSTQFQKKLKNKFLFGSLSHSVRDRFQNKGSDYRSVGNQQDFLLYDLDHTCSVLNDIQIVGDDVFAEIIFLDNRPGSFIQSLIGLGSLMNVSMSIYSNIDYSERKYIVTDFVGIDSTTAPALDSEFVNTEEFSGVVESQAQFSVSNPNKSRVKTLEDYIKVDNSSEISIDLSKSKNNSFADNVSDERGVLVSFSCPHSELLSTEVYKPVAPKTKDSFNFSAVEQASVEDTMNCFSVGFLQFYMEETRPARDSLKRRIQQVVNFIKSKDKETLSKPSVKRAMRKYIYIFILQKIQDYIRLLAKNKEGDNNNGNSANLIIALGIGPYLSDRKQISRLQMTLKMLAPQLQKDGTMQKPLQLRIKQSFAAVFTDILKTIEKKMLPPEKHGFLTSAATKPEVKEPSKEESKK